MSLQKTLIAAAMVLAVASAAPIVLATDEKPPVAPAKAPAAKDPAPKAAVLSAKVVSVSGNVQKMIAAKPPGQWAPVRAGDDLPEKTIIRTGLRSKVVLKFADRSEVTIGRAGKMGISEFRKTGDLVKTQLGLKYGTLRTSVEIAAGPNDFRVATPVALLSVRGTKNHIGYASDSGLAVKGLTGVMNVRSDGRARGVSAGETTTGDLTPPIELAQQGLDPVMGDALGGLTDSERRNLRLNGGGRGIFGFTGSDIGTRGLLLNALSEIISRYVPMPPPGYETTLDR